MRDQNLLTHRQRSKKRVKSEKEELKATRPNQIWSWDITYLKTDVKGRFYYLYMFVDIWSRMITGWEVLEFESGESAAKLMFKICNIHGINKEQLILHSDNGSPMKSATMYATLSKLGVTPSFSRPNVSDDNAYSESLFKTLKYSAGYPKFFRTIEDANMWVEKFVEWYNNVHLHSKIQFVTPYQRHTLQDIEILNNRKLVYEKAKLDNPGKWSKNIRNWDYKENFTLKKESYKKVI